MQLRLLSALLLLLFSGSCSALSITFINPGKSDEVFWRMVSETMSAAAEDLQIDLEIKYAERNRLQMKQLGLETIARATPPDYLILVNEEQAGAELLERANERSIKTLFLLNSLTGKQRLLLGAPGEYLKFWLGAIEPDNFTAGARMLDQLVTCADKRGYSKPYNLLALIGDRTTPASLNRNAGMLSRLNRPDVLSLNRTLNASWNKEEAYRHTLHYLDWAKRNEITPQLIWAANDPIAQGAAEALEVHQKTGQTDVCLVGLNWSTDGIRMVEEGTMVATDGGHFLAGAWSLLMLYDHHHQRLDFKHYPDSHVSFRMESLTADKLAGFKEHFADNNWRKVNFRRFSMYLNPEHKEYDFSLAALIRSVESERTGPKE